MQSKLTKSVVIDFCHPWQKIRAEKEVVLNYYRFLDCDKWAYVLEGDWILDLFKDYQEALNYVQERGYNLEDHCN